MRVYGSSMITLGKRMEELTSGMGSSRRLMHGENSKLAVIKTTKNKENKRTKISRLSKNAGLAVSHTQTRMEVPENSWLVSEVLMAKPTNTLLQATARTTVPSSPKPSKTSTTQSRPEPGNEPIRSKKSTTREPGTSNKTTMMSITGSNSLKNRLKKSFSPDEGEPNTKNNTTVTDNRDLTTRSIRLLRTGIRSRGVIRSVKLA